MLSTVGLATLTSALTLVATEALKGVANVAGRELWGKVKAAFGWSADPPAEQLPRLMAERLDKDPELAAALLELVSKTLPSNDTASMIVSNITATKSVIGANIHIGGDLKL